LINQNKQTKTNKPKQTMSEFEVVLDYEVGEMLAVKCGVASEKMMKDCFKILRQSNPHQWLKHVFVSSNEDFEEICHTEYFRHNLLRWLMKNNHTVGENDGAWHTGRYKSIWNDQTLAGYKVRICLYIKGFSDDSWFTNVTKTALYRVHVIQNDEPTEEEMEERLNFLVGQIKQADAVVPNYLIMKKQKEENEKKKIADELAEELIKEEEELLNKLLRSKKPNNNTGAIPDRIRAKLPEVEEKRPKSFTDMAGVKHFPKSSSIELWENEYKECIPYLKKWKLEKK
jgi:hypothetical protein